jgi:hypothetical protein
MAHKSHFSEIFTRKKEAPAFAGASLIHVKPW